MNSRNPDWHPAISSRRYASRAPRWRRYREGRIELIDVGQCAVAPVVEGGMADRRSDRHPPSEIWRCRYYDPHSDCLLIAKHASSRERGTKTAGTASGGVYRLTLGIDQLLMNFAQFVSLCSTSSISFSASLEGAQVPISLRSSTPFLPSTSGCAKKRAYLAVAFNVSAFHNAFRPAAHAPEMTETRPPGRMDSVADPPPALASPLRYRRSECLVRSATS